MHLERRDIALLQRRRNGPPNVIFSRRPLGLVGLLDAADASTGICRQEVCGRHRVDRTLYWRQEILARPDNPRRLHVGARERAGLQ